MSQKQTYSITAIGDGFTVREVVAATPARLAKHLEFAIKEGIVFDTPHGDFEVTIQPEAIHRIVVDVAGGASYHPA